MVRSSRSKPLVLVLGVVAVGILAFFGSRKERGSGPGVVSLPTPGVAVHLMQPNAEPAEQQGGVNALATLAPRVEDLRDQAEADPHGTPPALMEFADEVGREMEGAFDSPEKARSAARMLEGCALPGPETPIPQSARALCAENLRRLAERYPAELGGDWERVRAQLPARVLQLLEQ